MKLSFHDLQMIPFSLTLTSLASLERALKIIDDFGRIACLSLNVKKRRLFGKGNGQIIKINP